MVFVLLSQQNCAARDPISLLPYNVYLVMSLDVYNLVIEPAIPINAHQTIGYIYPVGMCGTSLMPIQNENPVV